MEAEQHLWGGGGTAVGGRTTIFAASVHEQKRL